MLKKIADYPMTGSQAAVVLSAELVLFYLGIKWIDKYNLSICNKPQIERAQNRQHHVEASLEMTAKLPVISKELENRIIISSLSELRAGLDNGEFSCEELLTCYLHRLRNLNREYRLINEIQYEDAILQARILDTELKSGQKRGFFHGIPISVKDMISIKKFTATVGLTKNAFNVQTEDSLVISALRAQGAIFFITGAVPQNTGSYETVNYKTGRALNPFNKQRTPGGSSGGDAGIVALGCASLSIGTDLYGSIRIPASFCGLYGIRPTSNRVSLKGPREFFQPYPCLSSGIGPMAKFADDCAEFMKALCNEHVFSQDANIPPLLWNEDLYRSEKQLKIGFIGSNSFWPLPDCMKRGLEEAKGILESLGHEFVSIELPDFDVINELLTSLYGNSTPKKTGEPPLNSFILNKPRSFWSRLKNKFTRKNKESFYYKAIGLKSGYEYVQNLIRVTKLKNQFIKEWTDLGIDVIITPFPTPAIKHDLSEQLYPAFAYVTFFNLLDCPAGSVPITVVKENEQFYPETAEGWTKVMHKNMEHSKDLPVCIQVISPPYKEELCLNVMRQLNEKNPFWKKCNFST